MTTNPRLEEFVDLWPGNSLGREFPAHNGRGWVQIPGGPPITNGIVLHACYCLLAYHSIRADQVTLFRNEKTLILLAS